MEDGFPIPDGWTFEVSSNRQVIEPSDDLITTIFDGGENVYVKVKCRLHSVDWCTEGIATDL
jgi:hypothetical protein